MSFKANAAEKAALANQQKIGDIALDRSNQTFGQGENTYGQGQGLVQQGTNFLTTLLNGNRANAGAVLAPSINNAREAQAQSLQAATNLMPRGGGRSASLFDSLIAPGRSIVNMFNSVRGGAAEPLVNAGMGVMGQGSGLISGSNAPLSTSGSIAGNILNYEQQNRAMKNQFWGQLGGGLFNLATMPLGGVGGLGGSGTMLGKLAGVFH
jgi:hypothetical protein